MSRKRRPRLMAFNGRALSWSGGGGAGTPATTLGIHVLNAAGAVFTCLNTVLNAAGTPFVITNAVLDADGNSFSVV